MLIMISSDPSPVLCAHSSPSHCLLQLQSVVTSAPGGDASIGLLVEALSAAPPARQAILGILSDKLRVIHKGEEELSPSAAAHLLMPLWMRAEIPRDVQGVHGHTNSIPPSHRCLGCDDTTNSVFHPHRIRTANAGKAKEAIDLSGLVAVADSGGAVWRSLLWDWAIGLLGIIEGEDEVPSPSTTIEQR